MRRQSSRRSRHCRRDRVDGKQTPPYRGADGAHSMGVLADAVERPTKRRMHNPPRQYEPAEQHYQRIEKGGFSKDVELEDPEDRIEPDPLQPVVPASEIRGLIGVL